VQADGVAQHGDTKRPRGMRIRASCSRTSGRSGGGGGQQPGYRRRMRVTPRLSISMSNVSAGVSSSIRCPSPRPGAPRHPVLGEQPRHRPEEPRGASGGPRPGPGHLGPPPPRPRPGAPQHPDLGAQPRHRPGQSRGHLNSRITVGSSRRRPAWLLHLAMHYFRLWSGSTVKATLTSKCLLLGSLAS
jgi:hypothetical protein